MIRRAAASLRRLFTLAAGVAMGYAVYRNGARWAYAYSGYLGAHHGLMADVLVFVEPVAAAIVLLAAALLVLSVYRRVQSARRPRREVSR